jgi:hypothetical protein
MAENAQKSEIHETTEDADSSPANSQVRQEPDEKLRPDADLAVPRPGPDEEDRAALFPKGTKVNRDDSDYGGPIDVEVDDNRD